MANYTLNYTGEKVDELLNKIDTAFGETTVMGDTLTWDGDTEGLDSSLGMLYRVSGATPSLEDCQSGGIVKTFDATTGDYTFEFTAENVIDAASVGIGTNCIVLQIDGSPIFIVTGDGASVTMEGMTATFEKTGIYFPSMDGSYVKSLEINNYTGFETTEIKPLDTKYLPKTHQFGDIIMRDTLTWDGITEGRYSVLDMFYKVSDAIPTLADLQNGGTISVMDGTVSFTSDNVAELEALGAGSDCIVIVGSDGTPYVGVALKEGATAIMDDVTTTFEETGVFFLRQQATSTLTLYISELVINGYAGFETIKVKPIPAKYIETPRTCFYENIRELYIDEECTIPVTTADIKTAHDKGLIEVISSSVHYMAYAVSFAGYPMQAQITTSARTFTIGSAD